MFILNLRRLIGAALLLGIAVIYPYKTKDDKLVHQLLGLAADIM
jgi:hypothetical protein